MTPVVLLVAFCAAMTVIAIGRVVTADGRDPVDVGTTLIVCGLTFLSALWAVLEESWLAAAGQFLIGVVGTVGVGVGLVVVARYWNAPRDGRAGGDYVCEEERLPDDDGS